jgi:2-keto-4-pentenoate hydratase
MAAAPKSPLRSAAVLLKLLHPTDKILRVGGAMCNGCPVRTLPKAVVSTEMIHPRQLRELVILFTGSRG